MTGRYDREPHIFAVSQNEHADNIVDTGGPGGPLDATDPDYDAKLAARQRKGAAKCPGHDNGPRREQEPCR